MGSGLAGKVDKAGPSQVTCVDPAKRGPVCVSLGVSAGTQAQSLPHPWPGWCLVLGGLAPLPAPCGSLAVSDPGPACPLQADVGRALFCLSRRVPSWSLRWVFPECLGLPLTARSALGTGLQGDP